MPDIEVGPAVLGATTGLDFGTGTFVSSNGTTSTWTITVTASNANRFEVPAGDVITATYVPATGFSGSRTPGGQTMPVGWNCTISGSSTSAPASKPIATPSPVPSQEFDVTL